MGITFIATIGMVLRTVAANGMADGARRARTVAVARSVARAGLVTGLAGLAWLGLTAAANASESTPVPAQPGSAPAELSEPAVDTPAPVTDAPAADPWPTAAGSPWSPAPARTPSFGTASAPVTTQLVIVAVETPTTAAPQPVPSWRPAAFFDGLAVVLDDIALQAATGGFTPPAISPPHWDALDTLGWTSPDPQPGQTYRPTVAPAEPTTVVAAPPVSAPAAATEENPIADTDAAVRTRPSSVPIHRAVLTPVRHEVGQRSAHLVPAVETVPARTRPATAPHEPPPAPAPATAPTGGTASSGSGSPSPAVTGAAGQFRPAPAERRQRSTIDDHDAPIWRSERASTSPD